MKKGFKILIPIFFVSALISCYDNSDCFTENGDVAEVVFRKDTANYTFKLPLNPFSDTANYLIDTLALVNAPITLIYSRKQRLLHPDCGMETVYEIDTALTPLSNDLRIIKREVTLPSSLNIEVFL